MSATGSELFSHSGVLRYREGWWVTLEVGGDVARYYRSLLPREWNVVAGRPAHITVVRGEEPPRRDRWGAYEGATVEFLYEPGLKWNSCFYWLRVVSKGIERVRTELGLTVERQPGWSVPPDGFTKYFHLTVGHGQGYLPRAERGWAA